MNLSEFFYLYRKSINEEIKDERVLAHLHTCINKIEDKNKEAIKKLVERLLNKIFIGSKNVRYKVSFCQREIPKAIEKIFGKELCSEDLK